MRLALRAGVAASATLLALSTLAAPVFAAAPPNDLFTGATAVSTGFSETIDTTEATTDADDAQLNTDCGAPATDASVWYALTVPADVGVIIDVSGSDYSAGIAVGTGTEGNLTLENCGPQTIGINAVAGTTYYVLAFDDQGDGGGNGGMLSISFTEAPPPPVIDFTVNKTGFVNSHTGIATVSGTFTCTNGDFADIFIEAHQPVGRVTINGFGEFFLTDTCDGESHPWSADIFPENGRFGGGKTLTLAFSTSCGPFECFFGFNEQTVQLKGGKK